MIDKTIRKLIRERAKYLCEYCHSSEEARGWHPPDEDPKQKK